MASSNLCCFILVLMALLLILSPSIQCQHDCINGIIMAKLKWLTESKNKVNKRSGKLKPLDWIGEIFFLKIHRCIAAAIRMKDMVGQSWKSRLNLEMAGSTPD